MRYQVLYINRHHAEILTVIDPHAERYVLELRAASFSYCPPAISRESIFLLFFHVFVHVFVSKCT